MAQFLRLFGSGMGQEALKSRAWWGYPPLLYTEGNQGPGPAGDLTQVILAKTRVGKSPFQALCLFCKALRCIRMWLQVDEDLGLV